MNTTNVDISWSGKAPGPNEGKTTTELDKPFIINELDLSILNKLLGTKFQKIAYIAIPNN
jgi:hypothetical protein